MDEKTINEFRQDLVSGSWVLFSPKRAQRPHELNVAERPKVPKDNCPFEDPQKSGNELVWYYPNNESPSVILIKNKFPALSYGLCTPVRQTGPFKVQDGVGHHEIFVLKDHDKQLADLSTEELAVLIAAYKKRKNEIIAMDGCVRYVSIFHNYGANAGASIYHPHSQLLSLPILPPDVSRSFHGARRFYQEHGKRVYDIMLEWEKEQQVRIVHETEHFMAFCPFVSQSPYEVRIFSKESHAHFAHMPAELDMEFAQIFGTVLKKLKKALNDVSYNLFFHTAPVEASLSGMHDFYNWHVEIIPVTSTHAGFEEATGVMINAVDPDAAAKLLRETDV